MNIIKSNLDGIKYNIKDVVRIVNPKQAATFMCNNAKLYDIYPSRHYETNEPMIVYIFNREEVKDLYDKWCNHELK